MSTETVETPPADQANPELVWLGPRDLAQHPLNARDDLGDLAGLTASIAAVGVIEALTVVPLADGGHRIVAGHSRCAAAIAAEGSQVPCLLRADLAAADDDKPGQAGHLARMIGENVHREGLTALEEARAYQQMLDLGLKPTVITRQTGQPRTRVLKGLGITRAGADLGNALAGVDLTLDQAAAVAIYAEDPDTIGALPGRRPRRQLRPRPVPRQAGPRPRPRGRVGDIPSP